MYDYENEIIEVEDFMFNHYLHHFDEYDGEYLVYNDIRLTYNDEYDCIEAAVNCIEEIIWN